MRASWKLGLVVVFVLGAALATALVVRRRSSGARASTGATTVAAATVPATAPLVAPSHAEHAPAAMPSVPPVVDLAALRAKLPDNLYWQKGVPTTDPAERARRAEDARVENALFGKVQSNTATEAEITAYYAGKRRLASDYATFGRTVLGDYGAELTPDERSLYGFAVRLNEQRLAQLPREEADARSRHQAYEARKAGAR